MIWLWVSIWTLGGLITAFCLAREMAPFDSIGDAATSGAMSLLALLIWPLIVIGWGLARLAEATKR